MVEPRPIRLAQIVGNLPSGVHTTPARCRVMQRGLRHMA